MLLIKETKRYLNKLLYICKRMFYVDVGYRKAVSSFVFDTIKELTEEFRSDLDLQDRIEINFIFSSLHLVRDFTLTTITACI